MRKRIAKTLTTISTFLLVVTASSVAAEGFTFVPEDNTGIVVENDFNFDEDETDAPKVQPLADQPPRSEKEEPLY